MTLQPVPQKRQGAFDQVKRVFSASVTMLAAAAGKLTPATLAATPAAWALMYCRRLIFMHTSSFWIGFIFHLVKDQGDGQDSIDPVDRLYVCEHRALVDGFKGNDELAVFAAAVNLGALEVLDGGPYGGHVHRPRLDHKAGDVDFSAHGGPLLNGNGIFRAHRYARSAARAAVAAYIR